MKLNKAVFLALFAFAFGAAQAVPVSVSDAAFAAKRWAAAGDALGVKMLGDVDMSAVATVTVTNGVCFHIIPFTGGGTVFTTADTRMEPVIAFSAADDIDLSESSPTMALLRKDVLLRSYLADAYAAAARNKTLSPATAAAAAGEISGAEAKWAALLSFSGPAKSGDPAKTAASADPVNSVSDVCVAPLVKSEWSQQKANGAVCYNYYTPKNYPCGCTATAMAQVMRYFTYPESIPSGTGFSCKVDGVTKLLSVMGGTYEWDKMKLIPEPDPLRGIAGATEEERKAIGKLTCDIGVALGSDYTEDGTGASPSDTANAMRTVFGYANAYAFWNDTTYSSGVGGLHDLSLRERIIYTNLDAERPVQLAIYGYTAGHFGDARYWAGHAVIADGYGYKTINGEETAFVHINMGWGGYDDMWYNIPEINTAKTGATFDSSATEYCYLGGATFNVFTDKSNLEVFSGRVLDLEGKPYKGAIVSLEGPDGTFTATSNDRGIYFFEVPGGKTYSVSAASPDGRAIDDDNEPVQLAQTVGDGRFVVKTSTAVGNSWGNDLVLSDPAVRVGERNYLSLDKALASVAAGEVVEVLRSCELRAPYTCGASFTLAAADAAAVVTRRNGAGFTVGSGAVLSLSNVTFAADAPSVAVEVLSGGKLSICSGVRFGVDNSAAAVVTADAAGLELAGSLSESFGLECAAAKTVGDVFGYAICDYLTASNSAVKVVDISDVNGEISGFADKGSGSVPFELKWALQPVPFEDSIAYYVDAAGATNCFRRFDRLFEVMENAGSAVEVVLREGGDLTRPAVLPAGDFKLRGEEGAGGPIVVKNGYDAGFTVGSGSSVEVSGIAFEGFRGNALFKVDGGELALEEGVVIGNVSATNRHSAAVAVINGRLSVSRGVEFRNCRCGATGLNGRGGAIYIGEGCELEMTGGMITGCFASEYGGGIFADRNSKVTLSGVMVITGNRSGKEDPRDDDLYLYSTTAKLYIGGPLLGEVGTWSYGLNKPGKTFAYAAEGVADSVLSDSARSFFNDSDSTLRAAPVSGMGLQWLAESETVEECAEADAAVRVSYDDAPGVYHYYAYIDDAFKAVSGDAAVEVLRDGISFREDIKVGGRVTLTSLPGSRFTVMRNGDASISVASGASLNMANLALSGSLIEPSSGYTLAVPRDIPLVEVSGAFTLADGACVTNTYVSAGDCAAVKVSSGGVAHLSAGEIKGCEGVSAGAVYIAPGGSARISGGVEITGNLGADGVEANVCSAADLGVVLAGDLTGAVGVAAPSSKVFGRVSSTYLGTVAGDFTAVTNGAAMFVNDVDGSHGVVATNSVDAAADVLLVWRSALDAKGTFTDASGNVYIGLVEESQIAGAEPEAIAFKAIDFADGVYSLTVTDVVAKCWYYLYATNSLSGGFKIDAASAIPQVVTNAVEDGEMVFKVPAAGEKMFWKVLARPELEPLE